MQALDVQPTPLISVKVDGNDATDQPELVSAMPSASGEVFGADALVGVWPTARQISGPTLGQDIPSAIAVELGYASPT